MIKKELAEELFRTLSRIKANGANTHDINQIRTILAGCSQIECVDCKECIVDRMSLRAALYLKTIRSK